jgi:hypothetical protein
MLQQSLVSAYSVFLSSIAGVMVSPCNALAAGLLANSVA